MFWQHFLLTQAVNAVRIILKNNILPHVRTDSSRFGAVLHGRRGRTSLATGKYVRSRSTPGTMLKALIFGH